MVKKDNQKQFTKQMRKQAPLLLGVIEQLDKADAVTKFKNVSHFNKPGYEGLSLKGKDITLHMI